MESKGRRVSFAGVSSIPYWKIQYEKHGKYYVEVFENNYGLLMEKDGNYLENYYDTV